MALGRQGPRAHCFYGTARLTLCVPPYEHPLFSLVLPRSHAEHRRCVAVTHIAHVIIAGRG